ncbi:hypothetical protein EYC84_001695 [Monilinia fructicola]|uniref:Uncharacterized protein n=1 Tax=Monilinia fructicola TaxID=38448 RepID=A0A5M9JYA4_MONFR|nr:hypothetical protein EYC84_001695 [Monilinia fructicola]
MFKSFLSVQIYISSLLPQCEILKLFCFTHSPDIYYSASSTINSFLCPQFQLSSRTYITCNFYQTRLFKFLNIQLIFSSFAVFTFG